MTGAPVRTSGPSIGGQTLKERARPGRRAWTFPELDVPSAEVPEGHRRVAGPTLPEVSETDIVRHFTRLSQINPTASLASPLLTGAFAVSSATRIAY